MKLVIAAVAVSATLLAVGCGPQAAGQNSPTQQTNEAAWRAAISCLRTHGMPDLPDPTFDNNGGAHFPPDVLKPPPEALAACQSQMDKVQPLNSNGATSANLSATARFARCMRAHGISDWPDPNGDGSFPNTGAVAEGKRTPRWPQIHEAWNTCGAVDNIHSIQIGQP